MCCVCVQYVFLNWSFFLSSLVSSLSVLYSFSPSCCIKPPEQPIRYQDFKQNLKPCPPLHFPPSPVLFWCCYLSLLLCVFVCLHAVIQLIAQMYFLLCSESDQQAVLHADTSALFTLQTLDSQMTVANCSCLLNIYPT